MTGIQLLLLTGVVFIGLYFIIRSKKRLLDLFLLFILVATAVVFIIWPDLTNSIARRLKVGRGADLIFYISILIFWFVVLKLYARMRRMEQALTDMARKQALDKAPPSPLKGEQ
jgi:hypothetical protein